jgi:hypothetical protein
VERLTSRSEGSFRFLCPGCGEMLATVNPRHNRAHCFCCKENLNNADLLLTLDDAFTAAVRLLERWLQAHEARQQRQRPSPPVQHERPPAQAAGLPARIAAKSDTRARRPTLARPPALDFPASGQTSLRHLDIKAAAA